MTTTRVLLLIVALAGCATTESQPISRAEDCRPTSEKEIADLFNRWNKSLQTGNPNAVVANYAEGSVLLPTVSNTPRVTVAEKLDYFKHFLVDRPVGTINRRWIQIGCNSALDTGLYTFTFAKGEPVAARYTYTYRWDGKAWLISSHHSSRMPQPPPKK